MGAAVKKPSDPARLLEARMSELRTSAAVFRARAYNNRTSEGRIAWIRRAERAEREVARLAAIKEGDRA
jgi:hypothetical protein